MEKKLRIICPIILIQKVKFRLYAVTIQKNLFPYVKCVSKSYPKLQCGYNFKIR